MKNKKEPIVNHGMLHDTVNVGALIRAQANMQTGKVDKTKVEDKNSPKVKKIDYKRINQPKK